jgi:hypothetical protein
MQGLPAGTYTFIITPESPFLAVSITNVTVSVRVLTELGTIVF